MSAWTKFATKFYQQQKKKNADYKFSQALKDAAKAYKKGGDVKVGGGEGDETPAPAIGSTEVKDMNSNKVNEENQAPLIGSDEVQGGKKRKNSAKKGKKSAKKGKKSAKKGGKKGKKSAKKSRR